MSAITTHVLDTSKGVPAKGIKVQLLIFHKDQWITIGASVTDNDGNAFKFLKEKGRCKNLMTGNLSEGAMYKLIFQIKEYFEIQSVKAFFPGI